MPRPRRSKTYSFDTDIIEYQRPFLDNLDFTRTGKVYLKSETEEQSMNFDFVWARRRSVYRWFYKHREEGLGEFVGIDSSPNKEIGGLNFVEFTLRSDPDNVFYLGLPKNLETNPFIDLDDAIVVSRTSDPTTDNNIFEQLIAPEYELDYVEKIEFDLNDNLPEINLDIKNNFELQKSVERTPEPSAISGMVLLGVLFVGVIGKRAVSKLRSRLRTDN
ncbi:MAG: hypothetical protein SXA11_16940 [Cyanobacteriota bacterium]|nr:hypothetical protein [Cyanobacteriota bacterium]